MNRVKKIKMVDTSNIPESFGELLAHIEQSVDSVYLPIEYMAVRMQHAMNYEYLNPLGVYQILGAESEMELKMTLGDDLADITTCLTAMLMVLQKHLVIKVVSEIFEYPEDRTFDMVDDILKWTREVTNTIGFDTTRWLG